MITALNNLDSVIDKYQTCVFSTTCDSPTDVINDNDCLNVNRVRKRFVVTSYLLGWALQLRTVGDSSGFSKFDVTAVTIFSSVNKIVLTSLDEHYSATVSNGWDLHGSSVHSALPFLSTNISQSSVATHLRGGGIFYYRFTIN